MTASQVPVTFRPRHLQGFRSRRGLHPLGSCFPRSPTRPLDGSASEVLPSEVFPFAAQVSVSEDRPSCRWSIGAPRLQGSLQRRSVGADAPRSSHGILSFRAFNLATHHDALSSRGPSMRFLVDPVPEGAESGGAPRSFLRRDPLSSLEANVPSWSSRPSSNLRLFGRREDPGLWILLRRSPSSREASGVLGKRVSDRSSTGT
jgi:hypothetical protein